MARLHSRKKGRSGSKKPLARSARAWVKIPEEQVRSLIEKLYKEGRQPAVIGQVLRDQMGVPSVRALLGKPLSKVLEELNLKQEYPADLIALIRRAVGLRKHLKANTRDTLNKIKLGHIESKIKRLVAYYRGKKLPAGWKYDPESAALLVK